MNPKASPYDWDATSIQSLRRYMGLSQQAMSAELGVRQQTISEWENGVYKPRGGMITLLTIVAERARFPTDDAPPKDWAVQPLVALALKPRATTALHNANLRTVGDVLMLWRKGKADLLAIEDFGPTSFRALEKQLRELKLIY